MRGICIVLTVAQTTGFVVGLLLFLVGSIGICGPTELFYLAFPVLLASSFCVLANLLVLGDLRRNEARDLERLTACAWAAGAPGVLATVVILLFFGSMWIQG